MRVPFPLVALALLVPGCIDPAPAVPEPEPRREPEPKRNGNTTAFAACPSDFGTSCFEPSIAVDGGGRIVVSYGAGPLLAVSPDGGATWQHVPAPPLPQTPSEEVSHTDALLQASPDGTLYFSAMVVGPVPAGFTFWGIQVASSKDGGRSWATDAFLSLAGDGGAPGLEADRQWLAFGPGQTVYVVYAQYTRTAAAVLHNAGLWVARSEDGGATWQPGRLIQPLGASWTGNAGAPVVDANGCLVVPDVAYPRLAGTPTVQVAVSCDGGSTFTWHVVSTEQVWSWPAVAQGGVGLHIAWRSADGSIRESTSSDGGATWSWPATLSAPGAEGMAAPWVQSDGAVLHLAWYEKAAGGARLVHATHPSGAPGEINRTEVATVVQEPGSRRSPANTDFAHFVLWQGRAVLAWDDGDAVRVGFA